MTSSAHVVTQPAKSRFLAVADAIGRRLVRDAVWSGETCNWMIWTKEPVNGALQRVYRAAAGDVYLGTAGIGLFLAHLAAATKDPHERATALGAARQLAASLRRFNSGDVGFYTGAPGTALALAHIGAFLGDEESLQAALRFCDEFVARPAEPAGYDLLSGQAGAILALTFLGQRYRRPHLIDHAVSLADYLMEASQASSLGRSWPSTSPQSANLLGLSHGTTGIMLALLELNLCRPVPRYSIAAQEALFYERSLFDHSQGNWPDFRLMPNAPVTAPGFPVAWCHGSTGMGMARLRLLELIPNDPLLLPEINACMQNAVRISNMPILPDATDFSPCHGLAGQAEFLLMAGLTFQRSDALAAAERIGDVGIEVFGRPDLPWPCGMPDCGETFSFMTGLAGIGYFFLRLFDPVYNPSVLLPSGSLA